MLGLVLISRSIIIYIIMIVLVYSVKKNNIKELIYLDKMTIWLSLIISSNIIINYHKDIIISIIPLITIYILREGVTIVFGNHKKVKNFLENDPIILIKDGVIKLSNLIDYNYSIDTLFKELRQKKIYNLKEVKYAILEESGELIIFSYDNNKYDKKNLPVILNSKINEEVLESNHISKGKLLNILTEEGCCLEDIFFGIYRHNKLYIIRNNTVN